MNICVREVLESRTVVFLMNRLVGLTWVRKNELTSWRVKTPR